MTKEIKRLRLFYLFFSTNVYYIIFFKPFLFLIFFSVGVISILFYNSNLVYIIISLIITTWGSGGATPGYGGVRGERQLPPPLVVVVLCKIIQIIIEFIILAFFNIVIAISSFYLKFVRFFPKFFWQVQKNWA